MLEFTFKRFGKEKNKYIYIKKNNEKNSETSKFRKSEYPLLLYFIFYIIKYKIKYKIYFYIKYKIFYIILYIYIILYFKVKC